MLTEKLENELQQLVEIGKSHDYKINAITFFNIYASLPSNHRTDDILNDMKDYLNRNSIELVTDEVEMEEEQVNLIDQIQPFNPKEIDISMDRLSIDSLIKRIKNSEINLNTEFQRKSGLWSDIKKSQLIESLLLNIPLPAFYFDASNEDDWLIIDGLQRITALREFVVDKTLKLTGLEFFHDLEGVTFDKLPRTFVRRIEETNIVVYKVNPGTPVNVKYNIFKRINTGGLELKPQEIRHALYQGKATETLKKIAGNKVFVELLGNHIKRDRMQDQEFVLRYIAVCYYGIEKYEGLPDEFLNNTMEYLNQENCEKSDAIESKLIQVFETVNHILGRFAFRKMAKDGRLRPINKAIFEVWCKNIFALSEEERKQLVKKNTLVCEQFTILCENDTFLQNIKASDKSAFQKRMNSISELIKGVLDVK
nr:DUF262 domain-containing protein [uncultured Lachnoclostridium sp.]